MSAKPAKKAQKPSGAKDIRAFFGGVASSQPGSSQKKSTQEPILISDDERTPPQKKSAPPLPTPTLKRKKPRALPSSDEEDAPKESVTSVPPPKKKAAVASSSRDTPIAKPKPTTPSSTSGIKGKKLVITSDEDEDIPPPKTKAAAASKPRPSSPSKPKPRTSQAIRSKAKGRRVIDSDYDDEDEDERQEDDYMEVDSEEPPPKKPQAKGKATTTAKASAPKPKPKPKPKEEEVDEDQDKSKVKAKFNWAAAKAAKLAGPSAPGSKAVPQPASPDCLAGLAFVFTGELSSFSRDEAIELAKRFGGRVVGQPSSKTSYVVLGDNAGPAKLAAIKKHNLTTLTEDAFLELIATRVVAEKDLDEKTKKKREKEQKAIRDSAKEMEQREKAAAKASGPSAASGHKSADPTTQLWTDRYAPQALKEICGNKGQVEKLQTWLASWPVSLKSGFKKPGKDGSGIFRAVMITGPPGIGKTTSAHLCAKLAGFTPIELNASDARSKKLVENSTNIYNTSLDGWMGGAETINAAGIKITDKSVLIMDEVDGMSAGDRGGVGALSALIRKTKVPIICIANDRSAPKMKPLIQNTFNLPFRKPDAAAIRSRIMTIAFKEKMKIPANVVDELINGVNSDIRQVLNMLSTWKLSSSTMDFDEGKTLAKMNEKYSVMTPFNIIQKIMGPYLFSATARETLNEKMELYFHDYSFVPLFVQENYLKTNPARVRGLDGPPQLLKQLELMDQAASSISDGDLVDALIHGSEQHWTLMPTHAVLSTIRPASFLYGTGSGYGGPNAMSFPQWLGQNSKQNKLNRALGDVQIRMRLKVSGDKAEIRQSYIPSLFPHIVEPLIDVGSGAVEDVIERMDEYYISREDWDAVVELGLGDHKDEVVLKKIATATKTALTRKYNASEHPVPFHKAQDLGKIPKKLAGGPAPDLEEAFEAEDEGMEDADDDKKSVDPDDIKNDKLVRQGGGKKASAKSTAKGKASTSKASTSKASTSKASTSKAKK